VHARALNRPPSAARRAAVRGSGVGAKIWTDVVKERPWFDQPDALEQLDGMARKRLFRRRKIDDESYTLLRKWVTDGYFIVDDCLPREQVSKLSERIDSVWFAQRPHDGLLISDVKVDGVAHVRMKHADLLALPLDVRERAKAESNWRIGEYHCYEESARAIHASERLKPLCSLIFNRPAIPQFSLTFAKGSGQAPHQDTTVFHVHPANYLVGVWVACEDIHPDSGPLEYYPGSHREPMYHEFNNYPQTNRRTSSPETSARYDQHVLDLAKRFPRRHFTPKAGSVLFWHGMLIHGGSKVADPSRSRKSFVLHYMPNGVNRSTEVVGPFNW